MASLRFNVRVNIDNPEALPELRERTANLQPAFEAIYRDWVDINEQKFEQAKGGESSGAQIFEEFWAGLTSGYMREKHPGGAPKRKVQKATGTEYPDWLMVRTGALMKAMTSPEALFHEFSQDEAVFGTPEDPDLADIVKWQAGGRQKERNVIFLSLPDMNAIRKEISDYLAMGGEFQGIMFARGLESEGLVAEAESMDAEFRSDLEGFDAGD